MPENFETLDALFLPDLCSIPFHLASQKNAIMTAPISFLTFMCRPISLSKYFLEYNGRLGRLSSDFAVDQLCKGRDLTGAQQQADFTPSASARASLDSIDHEPTESSSVPDVTQSQRPKPKVVRVLVGHSLGGICAAMEALRVPGEVSNRRH